MPFCCYIVILLSANSKLPNRDERRGEHPLKHKMLFCESGGTRIKDPGDHDLTVCWWRTLLGRESGVGLAFSFAVKPLPHLFHPILLPCIKSFDLEIAFRAFGTFSQRKEMCEPNRKWSPGYQVTTYAESRHVGLYKNTHMWCELTLKTFDSLSRKMELLLVHCTDLPPTTKAGQNWGLIKNTTCVYVRYMSSMQFKSKVK